MMSEAMREEYTIDGIVHRHRPLVYGQFLALAPLLSSVKIDGGMSVSDFILAVGKKVPELLAIALVPDGMSVKEACRTAFSHNRAELIQWGMSPPDVIEVLEDFFECNRLSSMSKKMTGMLEGLKSFMASRLGSLIPMSAPSMSSPEETSPDESTSSGESKPESSACGSE